MFHGRKPVGLVLISHLVSFMSRLLARPPARVSRRILRGQTAWYNDATDRLAFEIRQAMFARHQATVEREQRQLERQQEILETTPEVPIREPLARKPTSGSLLTYNPPEEPHANEATEDSAVDKNEQPLLPRKKLRALVALYHQSATFLTPETLDKHIEQEFAIDPQRPRYMDQKMLKLAVQHKNSAPEITTRGLGGVWGSYSPTAERGSRRQRLAGALWGVDEEGNPDIEAVEEAIERESAIGTPEGRKRF